MAKKQKSKSGKRRVKKSTKTQKRKAVSAKKMPGNNGLAALSYILGIITGIVVLFVADRNDRFARFHAVQSILFFIAILVVSAIISALMFPFALNMGMMTLFISPFAALMGIVWLIYTIGVIILWLVLIVKAYSGEMYKLPLLGDMAEDATR